MFAPFFDVSLRLILFAVLLTFSGLRATAAADASTILWVPSGPATVAEDEAVLRSLGDSPSFDRVDRCLATYEQLRASRCRGLGLADCLDRLGREAGADLVLLRRVNEESLDLLAFVRRHEPARRARLDRTRLGRSLPIITCGWLLHGRIPLHPVDPWDLRGEPIAAPPLIDLGPVRRFVGHGGFAVLELLRDDYPGIPEGLDVSARPRNVGGFVAIYHDLE